MKLENEQIEELKRERDDWLEIFLAYVRSEKEGLELFAGKDKRCGLCPKYKLITGEGDFKFLSCRKCPIVMLTGQTCYYRWKKEGDFFPGDEKKIIYEGMRAAWMTYKFIDDLIGGNQNGL